MGQANGAYRGDNDIVLAAAITRIESDELFQRILTSAEERGYLEAAKYSNKMALIADLPNLDEAHKEILGDMLKDGVDPFEGI